MRDFLAYINFGAFLKEARFAKAFVLLLSINLICILGSQFYTLPKIDEYWFWTLLFRILMLVTTYYLAIYVVHLAYFRRLQNIILGILIGFSLIILMIDLFLLYNFHTNLNSYLVSIVLESNFDESSEFLQNYLSIKLLGIYLVCGILLILIYKKTRGFRLKPSVISSFISICLIFLVIVHIARIRPEKERWSDVIYNSANSISRSLKQTMTFMAEYKKLNADFDNYMKNISVLPPPIG